MGRPQPSPPQKLRKFAFEMLKNKVKKLATFKFDKKVSRLIDEIVGADRISLLDVGAANGVYDRWTSVQKYIDYFAVEPDLRSSNELISSESNSPYNSQTLIKRALWHSNGEVTLNLCRKPMASSVYTPNREFIDLFQDPERNDIVDKVKIECTTIDDLNKQTGMLFDVIKLDVQGAELDVLKGATKSLSSVIAIDIEVELCELYLGQPLFDQIFSFLRQTGLEFIDFTFIYRWSPDQFNGLGQSTFADALFMLAPEKIAASNTEQVISKFAVISAIYERGDLLLRLATALELSTKISYEKVVAIKSLGEIISKRNNRSQRQLNRVTKIIRLFHPRVRTHILH